MFGLRCRGCDAHKSEIAHLMGQLERMEKLLERSQDRLIELASPGAGARAVATERARERIAKPEPAPPPRPEPIPSFPGYPAARSQPQVELDEQEA